MNEHLIPTIDAFLYEHLGMVKNFADDETFEQATEDERGGGDFLPLTYGRTLPDPDDPSRLLVCFSYGTNSLRHEREAPARVKQCMDALYAAHPEVAAVPVRLDIGGF
jgi:hypothetical protein